jgi:DNA mismatch repair protein MutL
MDAPATPPDRSGAQPEPAPVDAPPGPAAGAARRPIRVLPDRVINQIAAGEVVERPASVVKELLENALDAGATQISVTLGEGGKSLIAVLDNGGGMDEADALLAVQRHATSKLRDEAELACIATLGFRGEALASIASVSRFELVTSADETGAGTRLALEGGELRERGRVGFPRGTKVTVEELFHNVPARRKFLRATATELQHAQGMLVNLALAHPGVQFRLVHNGRPLQELPRCATLAERVYQLFGRELYEGLLPVEGEAGALRFAGVLSHPSHSRASRRWQYLFINGRPIRNAGINHAVYQAYRTLLMKERHPAYVLMLHLAPAEVDVNVHPAKSEVRLRNPQLIHTVLADQLHRQLLDGSRRAVFRAEPLPGPGAPAPGGQQGLPGLPQWPASAGPPAGPPGPAARDAAAFPAREPARVQDALPAAAGPTGGASGGPGGHLQPPPAAGALPAGARAGAGAAAAPAPDAAPDAGGVRPFAGSDFHFQPVPAGLERAAPEPLLDGGMAVLGQFHQTYLLVQRRDGLLLVDQHAAHERILFERYRAEFYAGAPRGERFLIPLQLELSAQNAVLLEQYLPQWRRMGFEIEPFGRNSYQVRQVPALLGHREVPGLILEVLDELALFGKSGRLEEVFNEILERVACHAAIRAGDALSREEMEALVAQLAGLDINLYCPHGRPVWVEFPLRELEKRFKRIV